MTKILVIESEEQTRDMCLKYLEAEGFATIGVENSTVGVQYAREYLPDLIISAIIPEINGYGVLRMLREHIATAIIPLIFVMDKATKADIRKAMELGADDCITKPYTRQELLRAITARLQRLAELGQWCAAQSQSVQKSLETKITKPIAPQLFFPSDPKLRRVFDFIEANYHRQITLKDIAEAVGYTRTYLCRLMRHQTGHTVQSWIIQRRMAAARFLLIETSERVEKIATLVGYQHPVPFFRQFRQYHETTPQAWRKKFLQHNPQIYIGSSLSNICAQSD